MLAFFPFNVQKKIPNSGANSRIFNNYNSAGSAHHAAGGGPGARRQHTARQNNAFAADAAVFPHQAAEFIATSGEQIPLPGHADFPGIMPEIGEDAPAAHVHIIANDGIADIGEVRHKTLLPSRLLFTSTALPITQLSPMLVSPRR